MLINCIRQHDAILITYSVADKTSFDAVDVGGIQQNQLSLIENVVEHSKNDNVVIFLVGNQIDLKDKRVISWEDGALKCEINAQLNTEFNSVLKYALRMRLSPKLTLTNFRGVR